MRSIGDGAHPSFVDDRALRSQDLDWLPGKILHINRDGKGLPSNPFFNGNPDAVRSRSTNTDCATRLDSNYIPSTACSSTMSDGAAEKRLTLVPRGRTSVGPATRVNSRSPITQTIPLQPPPARQFTARPITCCRSLPIPTGKVARLSAGPFKAEARIHQDITETTFWRLRLWCYLAVDFR